MKKKAFVLTLVTGLLLFGAVSSQAALIELQGLPATVLPGAGSLTFDVVLTDLDGALDINAFNFNVEVSGAGANDLTANAAALGFPNYIFPGSFFYATSPVTPVTLDAGAGGTGSAGQAGVIPGLLGELTFDYAGNINEIYTFALGDPSNNFGLDLAGGQFGLTLVGNTQVEVVPIPAAVWLLGSGLLALVGLRRKLS